MSKKKRKKKHGAYDEPGDGKSDQVTNLYWRGSEVDCDEFNAKLRAQGRSLKRLKAGRAGRKSRNP